MHYMRLTGGEPLLRRDLFEILGRADTSSISTVILQTNGLALKKLHREVNESPITKVAVSIDGIGKTNDLIRGINGYFDLAMQGIKLLSGKKISLSVTLNRMSAHELEGLAEIAYSVGAEVEFNILSRSLPFLANADLPAMWPEKTDTDTIEKFLRDTLKRPEYEVDYIIRYYRNQPLEEPPCVLGYLQAFVLSNGDVLTGCYPLKPVGNILRNDLKSVLDSEEYAAQCEAMVRRECPGCTCGIESSLAMKRPISSAIYELKHLSPQRK